MRRRLVAVALASVALLLSSACGGGDPALTAQASRRLKNQIAAVEYAIAGGEYAAAREGLTEVRATTVRMADRDDISSERAPEILAAIDDVEVRLIRLEAQDQP